MELHFTEQMAVKAIRSKWRPIEIKRSIEDRVYYNVSSATLGDIVFLVNYYYYRYHAHKAKCIKYALDIITDTSSVGYAYRLWLSVKQ
jgi:hypothetical protein